MDQGRGNGFARLWREPQGDSIDYRVSAERIGANGSLAFAKAARVPLGTDLAGRDDAFNPVERLLAALAACMIQGTERVAPMLAFDGVEVALEAKRKNVLPTLVKTTYQTVVRTVWPFCIATY